MPRTEHQRVADDLAKHVLRRAEAAGAAISSEVRRATLALAQRISRETASPHQFLTRFMSEFPAILRRYEPVLARSLTDAQIASWLRGGQAVVASLPDLAIAPNPTPWILPHLPAEGAKPIVRFPIIEEAVKDLAARDLFSRDAFEHLEKTAHEDGFLAGRTAVLDAYEKVRDALIDAVVQGDSLKTFRGKVGVTLRRSGMSEARQEGLFRNVTLNAYARGQKAVVEHPQVRSAVVFVWRANISDSRCTMLCTALSNGGYQGTGIYLTNSLVWRRVAPQSHHGCRCGASYLTIKRAAEKGILVAQKWLDTGHRPSDAELFVPMPDLSGVPANELAQFEKWVSPWQMP